MSRRTMARDVGAPDDGARRWRATMGPTTARDHSERAGRDRNAGAADALTATEGARHDAQEPMTSERRQRARPPLGRARTARSRRARGAVGRALGAAAALASLGALTAQPALGASALSWSAPSAIDGSG